MTDTIEIDRLQKRYGSRIALHELDLHVRPGTVFGPVSYTHLTLPTKA